MYHLFLIAFFSFSFSNTFASTLVLIGGGERPKEALLQFVQEIKEGPILILPWGSEYPEEIFLTIKSELENLKARDIHCLCKKEFTLKDYNIIEKAGGIYFPGGDQNKIMDKILKTGIKKLIHTLYQKGIPIAGTSAGSAIQSDPMLTGVNSQTAQGLGLLPSFIIDQHFLVRNREERLLNALGKYPLLHGIGIDESMSAVIHNDTQIKALGPSVVVLYLKEKNQIKKIKLSHLQNFNLNKKNLD